MAHMDIRYKIDISNLTTRCTLQNSSKGISNIGLLATSTVYQQFSLHCHFTDYSCYSGPMSTKVHLNSKSYCLFNNLKIKDGDLPNSKKAFLSVSFQ